MEQGEKWGDPLRRQVVGLGSFSRIKKEDWVDLVEEEMNLGWVVVVPWCGCGWGGWVWDGWR